MEVLGLADYLQKNPTFLTNLVGSIFLAIIAIIILNWITHRILESFMKWLRGRLKIGWNGDDRRKDNGSTVFRFDPESMKIFVEIRDLLRVQNGKLNEIVKKTDDQRDILKNQAVLLDSMNRRIV